MVSWGPDRIDLLLCGTDSSLYHKFWDGKTWSPGPSDFDKIGTQTWAEAPVTVSRQEKSIDTFTVGTDGKLYRIAFDNGSWKQPQLLGGSWGTQPVALVASKDRVDVFHIGLNGGLFHKYFDGQLKPAGEQFNSLGGTCKGVPAIARVGASDVYTCVLGTDNAIWATSWNNFESISGTANFTSLGGGRFVGSPVLATVGQNRVHLFARGFNSLLYHSWYDGQSRRVEGFEPFPGEIIGQPHVVSWGEKRLDVFSISPQRYLLHNYWDGASWSNYKPIAHVCKLIDNVVSNGPNRIDVFYRGLDRSSYHKWFDGKSWFPQSDAGESLGEPSDVSAAYNIPVTGAVDLDPSTKVQPRLEINDLHARHKQQFDMYIRAMANLQAKPELSSTSFYGIASIHGVPYIRWPFEEKSKPGDNVAGYCCHRSVLFPSWHRVYLLLLEQAVQGEALEIAKEFTGVYRDIYTKAARQLRLPYWDWTVNNSGLPRAVLYERIAVAFAGPKGTVAYKQIPNPLLKYQFRDVEMHKKYFVNGRPADANIFFNTPQGEAQPKGSEATDQIWSAWLNTMRCPDENGVTQHDVVDTQMYKQNRNLRDIVYKLMTVNEYQPFASTGFEPGTVNVNNYQSLEGIHDGIHVLCGIDPTPLDGHMGDPMYAGFDPLFWLHHCNVDRIYALWQILHPGVEVEPQVAKENTIMYAQGIVQDKTTPLYPFRHQDGTYFTSPDVDKWDSSLKFGYRYPETPAELFKAEEQDRLKRYVSKRVIDILAPDFENFPIVPRAAVEEANKVSKLADAAKPGTSYMENGSQIVAGIYPQFNLDAIHRREWLVNIKIENFAVDGSFFVHIFLGDFSPDPSYWTQDMNLVGTHAVFSSAIGQTGCQKCLKDKQINAVVSGAVSLTTKLLDNGLHDLEPETVKPYVKKNLHWRVQRSDGKYVASNDLPSLVVSISATIVESPEDPAALPIWGVPTVYEELTKDKAGGYNAGIEL